MINIIRNFSFTYLIIKLVEFFKNLFKKKESVKAISIIDENVKIKVRKSEPVQVVVPFHEPKPVQKPQRKTYIGYIMTSEPINHPEMFSIGYSRITGLPIYGFTGTDFSSVSALLNSMYVTYTEVFPDQSFITI